MPSKSPAIYPEPLVIEPRDTHHSTFIILHGRGSSAIDISSAILGTQLPGGQVLAEAFPNTRFVFPTASRRRAARFKKSLTNQWFDNWSHDEPLKRQELQIEGLQETTQFLHGLIKAEAAKVGGFGRVALGGISNGCAASLIATLLWEHEPLLAMFGMCGYLPFAKVMQDASTEEEVDPEDDVFERPDTEDGDDIALAPPARAIAALRGILDLALESDGQTGDHQTPIFLGHGTAGEQVSIRRAEEARDCLKSLDVSVQLKTYEGLHHWFSQEMLGDIVTFLKEKLAPTD